jgi:hypothetical protein
MPKRLALSQRALVVDRFHAPNKVVVERYQTNFYTFFLGFFDMVPRMSANLVFPPVLEIGYSEDGEAFQLMIKRVVRLLIADWLHESEQIRLVLFPTEFCDETL